MTHILVEKVFKLFFFFHFVNRLHIFIIGECEHHIRPPTMLSEMLMLKLGLLLIPIKFFVKATGEEQNSCIQLSSFRLLTPDLEIQSLPYCFYSLKISFLFLVLSLLMKGRNHTAVWLQLFSFLQNFSAN